MHVVYFCEFYCQDSRQWLILYRYFESLALLESEAKTDANTNVNDGWVSHHLRWYFSLPLLMLFLSSGLVSSAVWVKTRPSPKCSFGAAITIFYYCSKNVFKGVIVSAAFCFSFSTTVRALKIDDENSKRFYCSIFSCMTSIKSLNWFQFQWIFQGRHINYGFLLVR